MRKDVALVMLVLALICAAASAYEDNKEDNPQEFVWPREDDPPNKVCATEACQELVNALTVWLNKPTRGAQRSCSTF